MIPLILIPLIILAVLQNLLVWFSKGKWGRRAAFACMVLGGWVMFTPSHTSGMSGIAFAWVAGVFVLGWFLYTVLRDKRNKLDRERAL
jgi:hypothetical protein